MFVGLAIPHKPDTVPTFVISGIYKFTRNTLSLGLVNRAAFAHRRNARDPAPFPAGAAVERFAAVMATLYPCIARMFITDFPCVSIAELMLDYRAKGEWPYQAA